MMRQGLPMGFRFTVRFPAAVDGATDDLLAGGRRERMGNLLNHITCEHAGLALKGCRKIPCQSMQVGGGTGRIPGRKPLREQPTDHAC